MPPIARRQVVLSAVSQYDRVAGLLISLLALLGMSVGILLFIWIGSKFVVTTKTVPVVLEPASIGEGAPGSSGDGSSLEAPTLADLRRDTRVVLPDFRRALTAVDELVAEHREQLEAVAAPTEQTSAGGQGGGRGTGSGVGEGSGSGRGGRWEIAYTEGSTLDEYCSELDFFRIELAAVGPDGKAEYCRNFTQPKPTVDRDRASPETRLFLQWREGSPRREADRALLEKAGIATGGKTIVQFIPAEVEQALAQLEYDFARRTAPQIYKTRFAVRSQGNRFQFVVQEQIPR
jgi:hypothetical protein